MMSKTVTLVVCLGALALTRTAAADPSPATTPEPTPVETGAPVPTVTTTTTTTTNTVPTLAEENDWYSYAWNEPRLSSQIGVGVVVGGGVTGFTDKTMRDSMSSDVGGLWDARLSIGTHVPIGIDVSYLGTAADVTTLAGVPNGTLVGTTVEAALRWNIFPHSILDPYVFAGAGWQRYDVTSMALPVADSGMRASDNVAEFPMGTGIAFRDPSGFTLDLRGTFRATTDSTLLLNQETGNYAKLHTWEASAALGYEF